MEPDSPIMAEVAKIPRILRIIFGMMVASGIGMGGHQLLQGHIFSRGPVFTLDFLSQGLLRRLSYCMVK